MTGLVRRLRFDELANTYLQDPYTVVLPGRIKVSLGDDLAAAEFKEVSTTMQSQDLARLTQAAYQHAIRTGMDARAASAASGSGDGGSAPGSSSRLPQTTLLGGIVPPGPRRRAAAGDAVADQMEVDSGPGGDPGGSAGGLMPAHMVDTMIKQHQQSFSIAHTQLQQALEAQTKAHANGVQQQVTALAESLAHESRRSDERAKATQMAVESLRQTGPQIIVPTPPPQADHAALNAMRDELRQEIQQAAGQITRSGADTQLAMARSAYASQNSARQAEGALSQLGQGLSGILSQVAGSSESVKQAVQSIAQMSGAMPSFVDNRQVHLSQNVDARTLKQIANVDARSVDARSVHQKILNVFGQAPGAAAPASSSSSGGGGGGPGGGGGRRPLPIEDQALAIEDQAKPKKKKKQAVVSVPSGPPDPPLPPPDLPTAVPKRKFENQPAELVPKLAKIAAALAAKGQERRRRIAPSAQPQMPKTKPFTGRSHVLGEDASTAISSKVIQTLFNKERPKPRREQHSAIADALIPAS